MAIEDSHMEQIFAEFHRQVEGLVFNSVCKIVNNDRVVFKVEEYPYAPIQVIDLLLYEVATVKAEEISIFVKRRIVSKLEI